jgi:hypothetical protein
VIGVVLANSSANSLSLALRPIQTSL